MSRVSTTRRKFVVANWKMHTTGSEATCLARAVVDGAGADSNVNVALSPPFPYLALVSSVLRGSSVELGAQNLYPEEEGAFTGEVSPSMLMDVGCTYVIVGHSERRHVLGESDTFVNQKVRFALASGLKVILCVGETGDQRDLGQTEAVLDRQLSSALAGVSAITLTRLSIAYEPIWAIGTGKHASPPQVQHAHALIRSRFGKIFDEQMAERLCIQYGGSVNPENASELLSTGGVDGALVGGASLNANQFLEIVRAAHVSVKSEAVSLKR